MAPSLLARLLAGERSAVSEALNQIDDRRPEQRRAARALLDSLEAGNPGASLCVGITGAPGTGKSTLLDALVGELRSRKQSVGILAVDPSSQRSGGALLGDRFRMRSAAADDHVFVRSMAARERLGGLADATYASTLVLEAVYDWVFIETVGVGQSEAEIAHHVDTLVFVAQPGAGDLLQFMKAGLLELPDIFVVNKIDLGSAAERTVSELKSGLGLSPAHPGSDSGTGNWVPPVLGLSAREQSGIAGLVDAIEEHAASQDSAGERQTRRTRGRLRFVCESITRRYGSHGLEKVGGSDALARRLSQTPAPSSFALLEELGRSIEGTASPAPGDSDRTCSR